MEKNILLGTHHYSVAHLITLLFSEKGYRVDETGNLGTMLEKARAGEYIAYLMDVNLGSRGDPTIAPAEKIWE